MLAFSIITALREAARRQMMSEFLMKALGENDEQREREVVDLYFPGADFPGLNRDGSDDNFGSDDGKDSLGKLIGELIAFGVGFLLYIDQRSY